MRYNELESIQKQWTNKVCLFGAGVIGCTWGYDLIKAAGFQIDFYCDNKKKEDFVIRDHVKTISLEKLYSLRDKVLVFITVKSKYRHSIRNQLEENGIHNIICVDFLFLQTLIESLLEMNNPVINRRFQYILNDREYISRQFEYRLGYLPDLDNPKTFNEKLQWLKLHDRNPNYIHLVDKYEVKEYIANKLGEEYVIPTIGIYDTFDDIDFEKFPQQFVLKCTHDSGSVVLCQDKKHFNMNEAKISLEESMKKNYYWRCREWPYKYIKPRIIAEKYIFHESNAELKDYKLMCFNGYVRCSFVCSERFSEDGLKVTFYDADWTVMPFERYYPKSRYPIDKPKNYSEMIKLAEILSKDIPFVRIDFYEVAGKTYFGELTFYPGSGWEKFTPPEWDKTLGSWINIVGKS